MAPKKKDKKEHSDASPTKSLAEELGTLRRLLNLTSRAYEKRLNADLALVTAWNEDVGKSTKPTREQIRDLGDMLGLLRKLKVKPDKGRRRDLRKIDAVLEDLVDLSRQKRSS
jgi:hypothetical protein